MRILITGVAGFIGSRLAEWIARYGCGVEIVGIDDLSCGYRENIPPDVKFHRMRLGDADPELREVWGDGFDFVFHLAAYAAEGLSPFIRRFNYHNNLLATTELVNLAIEKPPQRFVFTSSMAVYGQGRPPFAETDPCEPIDPYGIAKRACELDIMAAGRQHGLSWTIIRPHNVYGGQQSIWQRYRNVLGVWMERLLTDQPLRVYGDGLQQRAFSFIDDCLPALWAAATSAEAAAKVINLGGLRPTRIIDAARLLISIAGRGEIAHSEPRHEVKEAWCTGQASMDLLGYADLTPLEVGLASMWSWAQCEWIRYPGRRGKHHVAPLEVTRGLYSYWRE